MALSALVVCAATACVGSVDRDEFALIVQERGGGLSGDLLVRAYAAIGDRQGEADVAVYRTTLTLTTVSASVRAPEFADEVDGYSYTLGGDLLGPNPESDLDADDDRSTFAASDVDPALLEGLIDLAVAETTVRGGWASNAVLIAGPDSRFQVRISITNDRAQQTFVFADDGTLVGVS